MCPDISIIVPIYNAEQYLEKCIDSILNQTFTNFEIILVNDGSTDLTEEICKSFQKKDERIIYVSKENGGSSSAKNTGMSVAKGKYIEFVDADDTLDKEYVQNLIKGAEDEIDLCVGNVAFCKKIEEDFKREEVRLHPGVFSLQEWLKYYSEYMPKAIVGAPWNKLYRKDIIQKESLKFDEKLRNNEDTQFNYSYLEKCQKIYVSDKPYYNYIDWGKSSASKGYIDNIFTVYLSTYKRAIDFLKKAGMYTYNEQFTKKYFIELIIGAINSIVVASPGNIIEKKKKIKYIIHNQDVQNAVYKLKVTDKKKMMMIFLIKRKKTNLIYALFVLNKIRKGKVKLDEKRKNG